MPRTAGAKNKSTITKANFNIEFLTEVLQGHARWLAKAADANTLATEKEEALDYAEAYKVLLNRYSQLENETETE